MKADKDKDTYTFYRRNSIWLQLFLHMNLEKKGDLNLNFIFYTLY